MFISSILTIHCSFPHYVYQPQTLQCNLPNGTTAFIDMLTDSVICPCALQAVNYHQTVTRNTSLECIAIANNRLVNGVCMNAPQCPPGQRSVPIMSTNNENTIRCVANATNQIYGIVETACESKFFKCNLSLFK